MDLTPKILKAIRLDEGRLELLEWRWPDMIEHRQTESELMLEMSLPPQSADASAEFPEIESGNYCFMGRLFVRYPGVAIHGRGRGGHIRILRCTFSEARARTILGDAPVPPIGVLQALLNIRSDALRQLMNLALRELISPRMCSSEAVGALHVLLGIELARLLERQLHVASHSRLSGWQYQRIRERLLQQEALPTVAELAALCGISVRHLNRQFWALTGSTVAEYVKTFWIDRAKGLLSESVLPIKGVAMAAGFAHPNSFARAFQRATGMTPQDFRRWSRVGEHGRP
ncbi:MAG: helix-turn-helix transcriptional regulator [Novosphingobium sp.]